MKSFIVIVTLSCFFGVGFGLKLKTPITPKCDPSVTTVSGSAAPVGDICPGDLIFEETFDEFDHSVWEHENTLAGGGVS